MSLASHVSQPIATDEPCVPRESTALLQLSPGQDGWLDLVVPNSGGARDVIYWGGAAGFAEASTDPFGGVTDGTHSRMATLEDYDGDGDVDVFITGRGMALLAFRNDGAGMFTRDSSCAFCGTLARGSAWGDFDGALTRASRAWRITRRERPPL